MARDRQRRDAILAAVEACGWRAVVGCTAADVLLLSGYWPVMGASVAVFTREGQVCVLLPEDEMDLARATAFADAELVGYEPETLGALTDPAEALVAPLRRLAGRLGLTSGEVGTALREGMQAAAYQSSNHFHGSWEGLLGEVFPGVRVVAADGVLEGLKAVRTAGEMEQLRRACGLAGAGFAAAPGAIRAGRREDEVAAEIGAAFARVASDGFERGDGYFFCMSGPNSARAAGAYARTRRRVLEEGDLVMIHANTVGDGAWTDITRTFVVGEPGDRQRRMREAIGEARGEALRAVVPGMAASEVDGAARGVLARHGFGSQFKHAAGHGVGFAATDANARPRIHPKSPDVLEVGMTFNIEPAVYFEGVEGMRHCDVVACGEAGAEVLTDF